MELRAHEATKRFGPLTAVDGVSLTVASGNSVAIHGPNGSGKTTVLRMLAGLSRPTEGDVYVDETPLYDRETTVSTPIGYLSHESMMYDDLTARENLQFHARLVGVDETRITDVLETVDLLDRENGFPREFSHGMRKRLSLARALLADPAVLLLDEPFTGLDQHSSRTLEALLEDRTVVLVTHDFETSAALCDRFLVLERGRLVGEFDGRDRSPEALRSRYREALSS
ncbi:MAG: heme exporter protein A [Halobacteriales archaeon]|jgi:heme exporter protein A